MTQDVTDPKQLSESACAALAEFILAVADTKRLLGIRYAEWSDGAPALEASVAASAMAQDELGHSRALLPLLKDFPSVDARIADEMPREQYAAVAFLDEPFSTWVTFVAANILIGQGLTVALEAARHSCYLPLRTRAVKILEEERFHWLHGEGWFKRLAADPKQSGPLAAKVEGILPEALCWFGKPDDDRLVREGILTATPDELRQKLLNQIGPLIANSEASYLMRIEGGRWQYTGGMPWARFDPVTRRLRQTERA